MTPRSLALLTGLVVVGGGGLGAAACSDATGPVACNPSLVGTWAASGLMDVSGFSNTRALHNVSVTFFLRTPATAVRCEHVFAGVHGTGDDGHPYGGYMDDSVGDGVARPAPPNVRILVDLGLSDPSPRGEEEFHSIFTGQFTDAATFRGTFSEYSGQASRAVEFRRTAGP